MSTFIGYTVGLECWVGQRLTIAKIEYTRLRDGSISLQPVSGHNLAQLPGGWTRVTADEFDNRPTDPANSTAEAVWALRRAGLDIAALD